MRDSCPSADAVRDFLLGKTSDSQNELLERHLAHCTRCQAQLEILSAESDSILKMVADVAGPAASMGRDWTADSPAFVASPNPQVSQTSRDYFDSHAPAGPSQCEPGRMFSNYRIMECIGQGGMGSVYRAIDVNDNQEVALKILKADRRESQEAVRRFARERTLTARLKHPHIVRAVGAGEHKSVPYLVMEFVSGIDLHQLVRRIGPLPVPEACHIVREAAAALQYAHDQQVIHRDVKPSNLMITADGMVKLLDLGLGQILELHTGDPITRTDQALGTLAYMSPEQLSGLHPVTKQSDIFSLGITLHELLSGQRPWQRPGLTPLISDLGSLRPDVTEELKSLVGDMIALTPSERPASMAEVEARLRGIASPVNLSDLVANYYSGPTRNPHVSKSELAKADTAVAHAQSTDRQLTNPNSPLAPPPVLVAPPIQPVLVAPPVQNARRYPGRLMSIIGLAIVLPFAPVLWSGFWSSNPPPQMPPLPVPPPMVTLDVSPGELTVTQQILDAGCVFIKNKLTGEILELSAGEMDFPPGKYQWQYIAPVALEEDGHEFEIAQGMKRLKVAATLTQSFEYPDLPNQAGASQSYRGQISRSGWNPDTPLNFNLTLEVMEVRDEPEQPLLTRLRIEIDDLDTGYTETAYLAIDTQKWKQSQLEFSEDSWVEARSAAIDVFLAENKMPQLDSLVVRFDRNQDRLAALNSALLPPQRLSVHDVLSLFFGQKIDAAAHIFNQMRPQLLNTGKRNSWLAVESNGRADVLCYVVSSRPQGSDPATDGYMLARRTSPQHSPFGFVKLEVQVGEILTAVCQTVTSSPPDTESQIGRVRAKLNQLRQQEFHPSRIPSKLQSPASQPMAAGSGTQPLPTAPARSTAKSIGRAAAAIEDYFRNSRLADSQLAAGDMEKGVNSQASTAGGRIGGPFDQATLPDQPSFVNIAGTIALGDLPTETIEATLAMLGSDVIDGREYRWIEVEVKTSRENADDYWEAARLQIDVQEYEESHQFVIRRVLQNNSTSAQVPAAQAWIAFGNKHSVFSIPHDGNLTGLLDRRLQLPTPQQFDRIGVVDLLSLVFDAKLEPRTILSSLRPKIDSMLVGQSRAPQAIQLRSKTGEELACVRWVTPPNSQFLKYAIDRCPQIPFGFYSVSLSVAESVEFGIPKIDIRLAIGNQRGQLPDDFSSSVFGPNRALAQLLQNNVRRLQPIRNWRVWTWTEASKTYKVWAEFGGTLEPYVLLRKASGQETRVPTNLLTDADREFVNQGRWWAQATFGSDKHLQRVLVKDDQVANKLSFTIPSDSNSPAVLFGEPHAQVDRIWLTKLRAAKRQKWDPALRAQAWRAFADHIQ